MFGSPPPPPCPQVTVLRDAAELIRYRPGPGRDLTDIVEHAKFAKLGLKCDYERDRLEVELAIDIAVERGPAATGREVRLPYFVAVIGSDDEILAKEVFTSVAEIPADRRRLGVREETEQIIPLRGSQTGSNFEIIVGFQLTEAELEANRRRQQ